MDIFYRRVDEAIKLWMESKKLMIVPDVIKQKTQVSTNFESSTIRGLGTVPL